MPTNETHLTAAIKPELGDVSFDSVLLDIEHTADLFKPYVDQGSVRHSVSWKDISTAVKQGTTKEGLKTVVDCLNAGMKLFDAVYWLTSGKKKPLEEDAKITDESIPSSQKLADALFYCYFFLLTQARYPGVGQGDQLTNVPKFLNNVMELTAGQKHYSQLLCSFEISKVNPAWIRHYDVRGLGQEAQSRFGLGVAGYRMTAPFKNYTVTKPISDELKQAVALAKLIATEDPNWDFHPATRSGNTLQRYGNVNENMGNLIIEVFTKEQIAEMVKNKILYTEPVPKPSHRQYKTWTPSLHVVSQDLIFKKKAATA